MSSAFAVLVLWLARLRFVYLPFRERGLIRVSGRLGRFVSDFYPYDRSQ